MEKHCPKSSHDGTRETAPSDNVKGVYYHDYLQLDKILTAQHPESALSSEDGKGAHDEMLFIITHQTYELWFKQIIYELDSCISLFSAERLPSRQLLVLASRLRRITEIQKCLIAQFRVLETMTPLDFLDFRGHLSPASGFQSVQFRLFENKLGLKRVQRIQYRRQTYCSVLSAEHEAIVCDSEVSDTLHDVLEKWLERAPFLKTSDFDFWKEYKSKVKEMIGKEKGNAVQSEVEEAFRSIFDESEHKTLCERGKRTMSHKAWQAAIFINLYRDEPLLQMPFQVLSTLVDIDELMTQWRMSHALLVHRMLGMKIGTGGSSGYNYLKSTASHHKCFLDLFNVSEFLLPRRIIPCLPESVLKVLEKCYAE